MAICKILTPLLHTHEYLLYVKYSYTLARSKIYKYNIKKRRKSVELLERVK